MTEYKNNLKLDSIRQQVRSSIETFAEKLIEKLGEKLQSITVVGSSLTQDYKPPSSAVPTPPKRPACTKRFGEGRLRRLEALLRRTGGISDINTVLVIDKPTLLSLDAIAGLAKPISKHKISVPLLMTTAYIERSIDVFGIEFLDFQLTHQTILGSDPFATLTFDKKNVRLQCERELKAMLIRLRQGYIAAAAHKKLIRDILISTTKGLAPLLRAMLWLKDTERPAEAQQTFKKTADVFSIDTNPLIKVLRWHHENLRQDDAEVKASFESVYTIVEQLALIVDELKV
jgi:hypothetical protein